MGMAGFTDKELEVIALRANGYKGEEIARLLGCSRDAVYQVVSGVYAKTGLRNAPELTRWAIQWGLDERTDLTARRSGDRTTEARLLRGATAACSIGQCGI